MCDSKRLLREHLLINDQKYAVSFRSCSVSLTYSQLYYEMYQMEHCLMLLFASFTHFIHKFIKEGEKKCHVVCLCPFFTFIFSYSHNQRGRTWREKKAIMWRGSMTWKFMNETLDVVIIFNSIHNSSSMKRKKSIKNYHVSQYMHIS